MVSFNKIFAILVVLLSLVSLNNGNDDKVNLSLYYESLCPACADFVSTDLGKVFKQGLHKIVNLKLIPYGNGRRNNNTVECQHGPEECFFNMVEACAIHVWPKRVVHFKYIQCVEKSMLGGNSNEWKSCHKKLKLDSKPLSDCYNSKTGTKLILENAKETESLNPPHEYVPWLVVNNKPLKDDLENFVEYVCKAYKGKDIPVACQSINSVEKKKNTTYKVCY